VADPLDAHSGAYDKHLLDPTLKEPDDSPLIRARPFELFPQRAAPESGASKKGRAQDEGRREGGEREEREGRARGREREGESQRGRESERERGKGERGKGKGERRWKGKRRDLEM